MCIRDSQGSLPNDLQAWLSFGGLAQRLEPVSYTHLDVYKRQAKLSIATAGGVAQGHGGRVQQAVGQGVRQ